MKRHGDIGRISASSSAVELLYVRAPDDTSVALVASMHPTHPRGRISRTARREHAATRLKRSFFSAANFPDVLGTPPADGDPCCPLLLPWFGATVTWREPVYVKGKGEMRLFWVDPVAQTVASGATSPGAVHGRSQHGSTTPGGTHRALGTASASIPGSEFKVRSDSLTLVDVPHMGLSATHRASIDKIIVSSLRGPSSTPPKAGGQKPGPLDALEINAVTRFHPTADEHRHGGTESAVPAASGQLPGHPVSQQAHKLTSLSEHHSVHQLVGIAALTSFILPPVVARRAIAAPDDIAGEGTIVTPWAVAPDSVAAVAAAAHEDVNRAHSHGALVAPEPSSIARVEGDRIVESPPPPHRSQPPYTSSSSRIVSFQDMRDVVQVHRMTRAVAIWLLRLEFTTLLSIMHLS